MRGRNRRKGASLGASRSNLWRGWRPALSLLVASLVVLGLVASGAGAAPSAGGGGGGGGGGGKTTTTTAATTSTTAGSTTTTVGSTSGVATPKLIAVKSLSRHRVLATYDRDLDLLALQMSSYAFYSTQAVNLPVLGVSRATNNQAFVMTAAQEPVTYRVERPKTSRPVTFTGSAVNEPKVVSATPLSSTQIVVVFSEPVGSSALDPAAYQITVQGSTTALAVTGATAYGSSQTQVLLTTAPQEAVQYVLNVVGNVQGVSGAYIDPTAISVVLTGSTVLAGPMLLSATPQGDSALLLTFDVPLAASATEVNRYTATPGLTIKSAVLLNGNTQVLLNTSPLYAVSYTIVANVVDATGRAVNQSFDTVTFTGSVAVSTERPKVVSAGSTGNKSVVVQFSKAMSDSAIDPTHYAIVQTVVHPEVGTIGIMAAEFVDAERMSVRLTTLSQAEVTYQVTAHNVTDVAGNPLADKTAVGGVLVDPTSFVFPGTPPAYIPCGTTPATKILNVEGTTKATMTANATATRSLVAVSIGGRSATVSTTLASPVVIASANTFTTADIGKVITGAGIPACVDYDERVNSDDDTLFDHEETRGWQITIKLANGSTQVRQVTSNLFSADTDGDGLKDHEERALNIDPRDQDTDDDGITDYGEYNEIYSDPTVQDTDSDGLFDGLESTFFFTSPLFDDTDGDQLKDGYEINVNRNPKVADLPQPLLTLGDMRLGLNVRFTESNGLTSRELETKAFESTLTQSSSQAFSRSEASSHEVSAKVATEVGLKIGYEFGIFGGWSGEAHFNVNTETSNTNSWSSSFTSDSSQATENAYTDSLSTEQEVAKDSSVTRDVYGATVQIGVFLEGRGNIAFNVRNLQVAALMQDPENPSVLKPIATLVPDSEPAGGFTLGPLVAAKGPIIFSNDNASPELVEELMKNPQGLVFRFANYDIVDEAGRNFAFTSQDVNDRTARIAVDYGGLDSNGDGRGDESEILRVATGIVGRHAVDTNGDGVVDENDRKVVFDTSGKQVGITLRDALGAAGLTWYDETVPEQATSALSAAERLKSFSTTKVPDSSGTLHEVLYRIRGRAIQVGSPRQWVIVTPDGIEPVPELDSRILYPGSNVTFQFVQDEDGDRLTGVTEAAHGCSESTLDVNNDGKKDGIDSDRDGLDDRFETLIGWDVDTPFHGGRVHSSCSAPDTDGDTLTDLSEAPSVIQRDAAGLIVFADGNEPRRDTTLANMDSTLAGNDWAISDPVTDPTSTDTDLDGLADGFELTPYRNSFSQALVKTSPEHHDSDFDQLGDGVERKIGSNPRLDDYAKFWDSDRDGLTDAQEIADDDGNFVIDDSEKLDAGGTPKGWEVTVLQVHPRTELWNDICFNATCKPQTSSAARRVYSSKFDPDTDDDGLTDFEESKLKTDPEKADSNGDEIADGWDTDGDGLGDFQEVKGFGLRDGSTVKTVPTNIDTDNDKRSDGDEADLPGHDIITVAVPGKAPYQAFSHPLKRDADLDLLVDGDEVLGEFLRGTRELGSTDPAKADTDGDGKSEYAELLPEDGRRLTVPDFSVEVFFEGITVAKSGDGDEAGEVRYQLTLNNSGFGTITNVNFSTVAVGGSLDLGNVRQRLKSVSTTDALYEEISISGFISEIDDGNTDCTASLPGFVASPADGAGRRAGSSLTLGQQPWILHRKVICTSGEEFDVTLYTSVRAS